MKGENPTCWSSYIFHLNFNKIPHPCHHHPPPPPLWSDSVSFHQAILLFFSRCCWRLFVGWLAHTQNITHYITVLLFILLSDLTSFYFLPNYYTLSLLPCIFFSPYSPKEKNDDDWLLDLFDMFPFFSLLFINNNNSKSETRERERERWGKQKNLTHQISKNLPQKSEQSHIWIITVITIETGYKYISVLCCECV